jgi:16S rRNA (uracil1498-N3)-methyltransferase
LPHFFISSKDIQGKKALITGPLAYHLKGPLRMKSGERIHLVDEKMRGYHCVLKDIGRSDISGEVIGEDEGRVSDTVVTLAQAIIKGKRMDLIVQKATELGITEIIPIISERSVVRPTPSVGIKDMRRWQIIAEEASQQSERWDIPSVHAPLSFSEYLDSPDPFDIAIILWERGGGKPMKEILKKGGRRIGLLVGPEGGFTDTEIDRACKKGFIPVTLGQGILRSETAAIAAISITQYELGRLGSAQG